MGSEYKWARINAWYWKIRAYNQQGKLGRAIYQVMREKTHAVDYCLITMKQQ